MGITHLWCVPKEHVFSHKNRSCLDGQAKLKIAVAKVPTVKVYVSRLEGKSPQAWASSECWRQAVKLESYKTWSQQQDSDVPQCKKFFSYNR
jgi:hypothetical protein